MTSRWLNESEDRAWRRYRRMFTLLETTLARELDAETGLSMADYTVLSNLVEAEERRWRISELARHMGWSQSRLSHHLRRMENRGLVRREDVSDDARGAFVTLTRSGLKATAAATPVHMTGVRRHMIDPLTADQIEMLGDIAGIVIGRLDDQD